MKVIIGKPLPKKNVPKNRYKFHIEWMRGDADSYEKVAWECDDELECEFHYLMHKYMLNKHPSEHVNETYEKKLIKEYFEKGCKSLVEVAKDDPDLEDYWEYYWEETPYDMPCDCSCSLSDFSITYFDENGVEYEVEVEK